LRLSLSRLNHGLPRGQAHPEVVQGTTALQHQITDALHPQAHPVWHAATARDAPVARLAPEPPLGPGRVRQVLLQRPLRAPRFLRRPEARDLGERAREAAQLLPQRTASREGIRGRVGSPLVLPAAALGIAEAEAEAHSLDAQAMLDGVVFVLAALTCGLCRRGLGAAEAPLGAVMGTRGAAGAAVGTATTGAGSSSSGGTTGAASASDTPRRWARAASERAGAAPRGRRAAHHTGQRAWSHGWAVLWPRPHRRPWTTGRLSVFRDVRRKHRRSAGVGKGQLLSTAHWRAVRGVPSRRHGALWAWTAASQDGTSWCNSSRVRLVQASNAVGRDCPSAHRRRAMGGASWHGIVRPEAHHTIYHKTR
jgi:hypothetical protein